MDVQDEGRFYGDETGGDQVMDFSNLKTLTIPQGEVAEISVGGVVLWKSGYTNQVPLSTESDGKTIYNGGKGYKDGYRLSSSGAEKPQSNSTLTGYIPCTKNDIIRLTGVIFAAYGDTGTDGVTPGNGIGGLYSYLAVYDSKKTLLHSMQGENSPITVNGVSVKWGTYPVALTSDVVEFDFSNYKGADMAYIRINGIGSGTNMIVTINEEIE